MKKIMFALSIITLVGVGSCQKTYHCQCYDQYATPITPYAIKASNTTDASQKCAALISTYNVSCFLQN